MRAPIMVLRYPYRSETIPLSMRPRTWEAVPATPRAVCQLADTTYVCLPSTVTKSPYFLTNAGKAQKLPKSQVSYPSIMTASERPKEKKIAVGYILMAVRSDMAFSASATVLASCVSSARLGTAKDILPRLERSLPREPRSRPFRLAIRLGCPAIPRPRRKNARNVPRPAERHPFRLPGRGARSAQHAEHLGPGQVSGYRSP